MTNARRRTATEWVAVFEPHEQTIDWLRDKRLLLPVLGALPAGGYEYGTTNIARYWRSHDAKTDPFHTDIAQRALRKWMASEFVEKGRHFLCLKSNNDRIASVCAGDVHRTVGLAYRTVRTAF